MMFMVGRLQELKERKVGIPLFLFFIDIQKAHDSGYRNMMWQVLSRLGVPPQRRISSRETRVVIYYCE